MVTLSSSTNGCVRIQRHSHSTFPFKKKFKKVSLYIQNLKNKWLNYDLLGKSPLYLI